MFLIIHLILFIKTTLSQDLKHRNIKGNMNVIYTPLVGRDIHEDLIITMSTDQPYIHYIGTDCRVRVLKNNHLIDAPEKEKPCEKIIFSIEKLTYDNYIAKLDFLACSKNRINCKLIFSEKFKGILNDKTIFTFASNINLKLILNIDIDFSDKDKKFIQHRLLQKQFLNPHPAKNPP